MNRNIFIIIYLAVAGAMSSFVGRPKHSTGPSNITNDVFLSPTSFIQILEGADDMTMLHAIRNVPSNKKVATVEELGAYLKSYLLSPEFINRYSKLREVRKPLVPVSIQLRLEQEIKAQARVVKDAERDIQNVSAALKPQYQSIVQKSQQRLTALENEYDPQHEKEIELIRMQYDYDMGDYIFRTREFEKKYPLDARVYVKMKLKEFLATTTDIDFNAKTIENGNVTVFVNPHYEAKPVSWKFCFYAGKDASGAARKFVSKWLAAI